jgi:hypothetical protein
MNLVKVFANHSTMLTAAVHQTTGKQYIIRQYDRSLRCGLVGTTSAPNYTRACQIAAGFVYSMEATQ